MADDKLELTRRKILGAAGAVGVAGAGAGLGTSALFSDEESFENNEITAGTLDLKVGWEEHYFKGKNRLDYTTSSDVSKSDVQYVDGSPAGGRTTLPLDTGSPADGAVVSVPDDPTALGLLDVTEVDQRPDSGDTYDDVTDSNACSVLPDGSEDSDVIIDLDDVKPGDFGEITFSFALCDNPGYLWLQGCLQDSSEGGVNEPEANSSDEDQQEGTSDEPPLKSGSGDGTVELLDEVQAAWWYDNGDNLQSGGGGGGGGGDEVDLSIVFDTSGSMSGQLNDAQSGAKDLVDAVGSNVQVGLVSFEDKGDEQIEATLDDTDSDVKTAIDNLSAGGSTALGAGIDLGQGQLDGTASNSSGARTGADKVMVVLADGDENEGTGPRSSASTARSAGTEIYSIAYSTGANNDLMEDISSPPKVDDGTIDSDDEFAFVADTANISQTFNNIGGQVGGGEELINTTSGPQSQGSLREILNELCPDQPSDYGLPLDGDQSTAYDEQNDPPDDSDRDPFAANERHDIGFAWWVPRDVGNQIQSDSATFSLGLYAAQSRNNPGSGSA